MEHLTLSSPLQILHFNGRAMKCEKVYIEVVASFRTDGLLLPREIVWEDGVHYSIDRVSCITSAASIKAGGQGDRYTVWLHGKQRYLFFERSALMRGNIIGRWFVEK